jgi:hypothetical protein
MAIIIAGLCLVGLFAAGRDLLALRRRRADRACARCGHPFDPEAWPTRSQRTMEGGPFVSVTVCPRCGEPWTATGSLS